MIKIKLIIVEEDHLNKRTHQDTIYIRFVRFKVKTTVYLFFFLCVFYGEIDYKC